MAFVEWSKCLPIPQKCSSNNWKSSESDDPLQYWAIKQTVYPDLARLAAKYLALPASSVPVERLFGVADPNRCNLSDQCF